MKINKYYEYYQMLKGKDLVFGWKESDKFDVFGEDVIISFEDKKSEDKDSWTSEEGINATRVSDYEKYFEAVSGFSPQGFIKTWTGEEEYLEDYQKDNNEKYRKDQGLFLMNLAKLIFYKKTFSMWGRVYKYLDS